jgi:hypothetical protein
MPTRAERVEGGLIGLLVSDALGVPYEFSDPAALPPGEEIELSPPAGFAWAHRGRLLAYGRTMARRRSASLTPC